MAEQARALIAPRGLKHSRPRGPRELSAAELPIRAVGTLVAPQPLLEIRPRLYEARPETLAVDMQPLLRKVDIGFVRGEAIRLDTAARRAESAQLAGLAGR